MLPQNLNEDPSIVTIAADLLESSDIDPRWARGPFFSLKQLPPKGKGKRFELIAESVFTQQGMDVRPPLSTDHDRIVDGLKIEIKGSTVTKGSDDCFSFLQIRPAQDYDFLVLEAFYFFGLIEYYRIPKQDIAELIQSKIFKSQHGGNEGNSGTFIYNGPMTPFAKYFWFKVKVPAT